MRIGLLGAGRIGAFHAETIMGLPAVSGIVVHDTDASRARAMADKFGVEHTGDVDGLLGSGVDGLVIATPTTTHPGLIRAGARAGLPIFCEKPIAGDIRETRAVLAEVTAAGVPLQVGFQRRFDAGYQNLRQAVRDGRLGRLHTLRACTSDPAPPPAEYLPGSGGIFRDCSVHDYDIIRWVTGREIIEVYATGANGGADFFAAADDVDTGVSVLTLDDGTLAVCTATRYNGGGYDVRLEACGDAATLVAGLTDEAALVSAEGTAWPADTPSGSFAERFHDAYVAELTAFTELVAGGGPSPCTGEDALAAFLVAEAADRSRRTGRPVSIAEAAR